jgi:hypothetical protein
MSGRTVKCAAALCFAAFFATATARALPARDLTPGLGLTETVWAWMTARLTHAWTALASTAKSRRPPLRSWRPAPGPTRAG